ncbi:MAG: UDP-N-acetylmuramoyl-L-alanyl-D-glutamate--2,6-diaminopimelate ligase [Methylacidiphilales bacterium]|nr:UDP-N-acetylmuramoyl-L-alanyl-D-glutamate--2,6-diaminopimelate ligase [Candidatus Methylacidiphilales bacterium]
MKLSSVISNLEVETRSGDADPEISGVAYDVAQVRPGSAFCTWKGLKSDGHRFVPEAVRRGASALILEELPAETVDCPVLVVDSGRRALSQTAANFYGNPADRLEMIGVTGTNGKTSTAYLLHYLFEKLNISCGLIGTVEYRAGRRKLHASRTTPESADLQALLAEMRDAGCRAVVMEVSSHALELERVYGIPFRTAAFTNLTRDHLDFHIKMENYFSAKAKLFSGLAPGSRAVVNIDDAYGKRMAEFIAPGVHVATFGFDAAAMYRADRMEFRADGTTFDFESPEGTLRIQTRWVGRFNVSNMLAALAVMLPRGCDPAQMAAWMKDAPPVPGRLQPVEHEGPFSVLVDYAHTDDAVRNVLQSVRLLCRGKLHILIGCGGDRDRSKRPLMARAACELADRVVFTSDNPRSEDPGAILSEMTAGVPEFSNYSVAPNRAEAIAAILKGAGEGDLVLLAGKGHETTQEIAGELHHFSDAEVAARILKGGAA